MRDGVLADGILAMDYDWNARSAVSRTSDLGAEVDNTVFVQRSRDER